MTEQASSAPPDALRWARLYSQAHGGKLDAKAQLEFMAVAARKAAEAHFRSGDDQGYAVWSIRADDAAREIRDA